jgi:hypothetical protein
MGFDFSFADPDDLGRPGAQASFAKTDMAERNCQASKSCVIDFAQLHAAGRGVGDRAGRPAAAPG